jgi:ribosomal protein L7/L12
MQYIEFHNWQYGYRKILSTKLFQEHFGMGLKEAHERTDILLDKQSFILPVESEEKANEIIKQFTEIGALCRLVKPA